MVGWLPFTLLSSCRNSGQSGNSQEESPQNQWEDLFNGEDLAGWYTYQREPEPTSEVAGIDRDAEGSYLSPIGLNRDPLNVFTVVSEDGAPAIRISGEVFGILVTEKEFENYHLKLEFKWGELKWPPRKNDKRDSGVLYHSVGKEGAWGGVWMRSLECQVQEGDVGDFICVDTVMAKINAIRNNEDQRYYFTPGADPMTFSVERSYCNKGADFEKPNGEWNTLEIYTVGNRSVHVVNGKVNNRVYDIRQVKNGIESPLSKGKIQLQSEGAEVFYRSIQLEPVDKIPASLSDV